MGIRKEKLAYPPRAGGVFQQWHLLMLLHQFWILLNDIWHLHARLVLIKASYLEKVPDRWIDYRGDRDGLQLQMIVIPADQKEDLVEFYVSRIDRSAAWLLFSGLQQQIFPALMKGFFAQFKKFSWIIIQTPA